MAWQAWASVVLSGSVGAVIGLIGVYIAFRLSTKGEARVAAETQTSTAVARIATAQWELARLIATGRFLTAEAAIVDFNEACAQFTLSQIREHRGVALWVLARSERVTKLFSKRPGSLVRLWMRGRTIQRISQEMGETTGTLVAWVAGERDDDWFDARPSGQIE